MQDESGVDRSGVAIVASQLDGLCQALVIGAQLQLPVEEAARERLKIAIGAMKRIGNGPAFEHLPEVGSDANLSELLVVAHWCRSTMLAFVGPDEFWANMPKPPTQFGLSSKVGMRSE